MCCCALGAGGLTTVGVLVEVKTSNRITVLFRVDGGLQQLLRALCCVRRRSSRQRDFLRSESLSAHQSFKALPHAPHNSSKQLWRRRMGVALRRQKDQRLCSHRRSAPPPNNLQRFLNKSTLLCLLPILSCDAYLLFVCRGHSY